MWQDQVIVKIINLLATEGVMIYEANEILDQTKLVAQESAIDRVLPKWKAYTPIFDEDSESSSGSLSPCDCPLGSQVDSAIRQPVDAASPIPA